MITYTRCILVLMFTYELEQDFKIDEAAKYMKDGDIIAYDIMVDEKKLKKVLKRLEEFDC